MTNTNTDDQSTHKLPLPEAIIIKRQRAPLTSLIIILHKIVFFKYYLQQHNEIEKKMSFVIVRKHIKKYLIMERNVCFKYQQNMKANVNTGGSFVVFSSLHTNMHIQICI